MRPINVHIDTTIRLEIPDELDLEDETQENSVNTEAIGVLIASFSPENEDHGSAVSRVIYSDIAIEELPTP